MNQVATVNPARSPLLAMSERLEIDAGELENVIKQTVMPSAQVSNEQFVSFVAVANSYKLDPLKREIFAFPAKGGGIQPVVSIDGWLSIINSHPEFDGMDLEEGYDDQGKFISVTCRMFRKDRQHPVVITEFLDECKRNTEPWKKEKRMLRHKATIQCARYTFGLGGIMEQDEAEAATEEREIAPQPRVVELEPYPAADFETNLPKWQKYIEAGKQTPEDIIAKVSTKGTLTDEQKQKIRDLAPIDVDTETGEVMQ